MRVKALITLTLLALIVTACATTSADRQNVRTPEELDYMLKVREISVRFISSWKPFANVFDTKDINLIYQTTLTSTEQIQPLQEQLSAMTPPIRYSEFHQNFIKVFDKDIIALSQTKKACEILLGLEEGTEDEAVQYLNMSAETIDNARKLMLEAKAIWPE